MIITELNQKCLNLKQEIDKKINEVGKGQHNFSLDKAREKIFELDDNLGHNLKTLEKLVLEKYQGEPLKIWKK